MICHSALRKYYYASGVRPIGDNDIDRTVLYAVATAEVLQLHRLHVSTGQATSLLKPAVIANSFLGNI